MTHKQQLEWFDVEESWHVLLFPEKPNGFLLFVFGDAGHTVGDHQATWLEHPTRSLWLEWFAKMGYTICLTQPHPKHWGSEHATKTIKRLIHVVTKKGIFNQRVHLFAEGMGALLGFDLLRNGFPVRSAFFVNPILSLEEKFQREQRHVFFFKQWKKDVMEAHDLHDDETFQQVVEAKEDDIPHHVPMRWWFSSHQPVSPYLQKLQAKGLPPSITVTLGVPELFPHVGERAARWFALYEKEL
ncbi:hypothetical protein [Bacillus fonticola]|uniref:hypothetical protein n=1 Tax=Bacillus fonticola TaxID=2728853 RepID=UPI001473CDF1|nr:hypothetical protein [Bacillus fonticola]